MNRRPTPRSAIPDTVYPNGSQPFPKYAAAERNETIPLPRFWKHRWCAAFGRFTQGRRLGPIGSETLPNSSLSLAENFPSETLHYATARRKYACQNQEKY